MGSKSAIEWTQATWNPVTGCTKVSPGCKHCYAERMATRLQAMGQARYANGFRVTLHPDLVDLPRRWWTPRLIFVNSMSDLFHEAVPDKFIRRIFDTMVACPHHTFQILTKRSRRLAELASQLPWPPHIWMGVSVENQHFTHRIECLRHTDAHVKFLSLEPLLGPLHNLDLQVINWVIVGGESGPGARPMDPSWVTDIRDQCQRASVPFFFKQWGGVHKRKTGRLLDGRSWDEMPVLPGKNQVLQRMLFDL
jgi:protein gp37